jgi:hypothetical protein
VFQLPQGGDQNLKTIGPELESSLQGDIPESLFDIGGGFIVTVFGRSGVKRKIQIERACIGS